jgi:uncharacterized membrane protein
MKTKTSSFRLSYLDWVRGLGALIMLQGHVFDSFLRNDLRGGAAYIYSQFVGGMPPAIFLFLTGVTLAFLMDSTQRKGMPPLERVFTAFRRSGYLFALAFAFRLQMFLFGWPANWHDLFKVDILNCMGFGIAAMSVMAVFRTVERIKLCAVLGVAIAGLSPVISAIDTSWIPTLVRGYVVPDYHAFSFFPWAAYLVFGVSAGSLIRVMKPESTERAMQWAALTGGAVILACQYCSALPYSLYTKSDYWLNSPAQVLTKMGVVLVLIAVAFLWTRYGGSEDRWSLVRQFGTTSLLVYWVHIELVYGRWLWFWKNGLNVGQTVSAAVGVILLMLAISAAKTYRSQIGSWLSEMAWQNGPRTESASGD